MNDVFDLESFCRFVDGDCCACADCARSINHRPGMDFVRFFAELKRRKVYQVAVAYAVVAWLLIQVATQVFPFFEIPNWAVQLVVLALVIGFPIALVLAWAFELTPEGIKREQDIDPRRSRTRQTGRKLTALIIVVATLAAGVTAFRFLHSGRGTAQERQASLAAEIESKSIAVLPFENRSEEKANAYFADGIHEEILTRLSKISFPNRSRCCSSKRE